MLMGIRTEVLVYPFKGDKENRWQRYRSQRRIPSSELSLKNICGYWATEDDWESLSFRIGDREPAITWLPRKEEILRFTNLAKSVHDGDGLPKIVEIGAGTGILSYLLAETNELNVTAIDPDKKLLMGKQYYQEEWDSPEQLVNPYSHPNLRLINGTSKTALELFSGKPPDLVISSWMPEKIDLTPDILAMQPKAIVYINPLKENYDPNNPVFALDNQDKYPLRFSPRERYRRVYSWIGPSKDDVISFSEVANTISYGNELKILLDNFTEIQLREDIPDPEIPSSMFIPEEEKYTWEQVNLEKLLNPSWLRIFTDWPKYQDRLPILKQGLTELLTVQPIRKYSP